MSRLMAERRRTLWLGLSAIVIGGLLSAVAAGQSNAIQRVQYGQVVSAEPITIKDRPSGQATRSGSTVGAVAGAAIAKRGDRFFGALIGGAVGGAMGRAADKAGSIKQGIELIIKLDQGEEIAIQIPGTDEYVPGDRVRLTSGPQGTKVKRISPEAGEKK